MAKIFGVFFLAVCFAFCAYLWVPGVLSDLTLDASTLQPAEAVEVKAAKCTVHAFVVSTCEISVHDKAADQTVDFHYALLGNLGGEGFTVLRSTDDAELLTTSVGLDYVWNRLVTALLILLIGLAIVSAGLQSRGEMAPAR